MILVRPDVDQIADGTDLVQAIDRIDCLGQGDCVKVCEQKAISIENGRAVINQMCCGCGKCINICPQNIIKMLPPSTKNLLDVYDLEAEVLELCNKGSLEKNVEWKPKKYFKLWAYCYKIINIFQKI